MRVYAANKVEEGTVEEKTHGISGGITRGFFSS
jgi:hypothetical protein